MENISIDNTLLLPALAPGWRMRRRAETPVLERKGADARLELNAITETIIDRCDGKRSVAEIIDSLCEQYPAALEQIPGDVENVLGDLQRRGALTFAPVQQQQVFTVPERSAPHQQRRRLCVGMATYDDYDGVYFSVQALRLYHPEILSDLEIVVIDNHPDGPCAEALKHLGAWVPGYRYVPCQHIRGTAVRDLIFREANADYVLCIDSHVMVEASAIKRLLDYFETHPDTQDLLQGPLLSDDLRTLSTHFRPEWREGMYGAWGYDERGGERDGPAFDIPMQGLGLFACARAAWPGFNPRFTGFGGEEGYLHEKFRQAGGRTLCLPFLRWLHRFVRPLGTRYEVHWEDRVRNYLIGRNELGLQTDDLIEHFRAHIGAAQTDEIAATVEAEINNPYYTFDALYALVDRDGQWLIPEQIAATPGILQRVRQIDAGKLPASCPLALHGILREALELGYQHILVIDTEQYAFERPQFEAAIAALPEDEEQAATWLDKEHSLAAWYAGFARE